MAVVKNSRVGLNVERVEDRLVLTASVDASFVGGALTLTGDNNNDSISVQQVTVGHGKSAVQEIEISGGHHTQLTSTDKSLTVDAHGNILVPTADAVTSLSIMLGTGDNNVSITKMKSLTPSTITITDSGSSGNNSVMINGVSGETSLAVTLGSGKDNLTVGGSSLGMVTATLSSAANTSDNVQFNALNVSGTTSITTGSGNDRVELGGDNGHPHGTYSGAVTISLGAGNDHAQMNNATFSSTLNIDGVSGTDAATGHAQITKANLTVVNATNHINTN